MDTSTPTTPYTTVADIIRKQQEIEHRLSALERCVRSLPDDIDRVADGLGYPINNVHETRARLHQIAAKMRAHLPTQAAQHG
jgi:hypothetical protein